MITKEMIPELKSVVSRWNSPVFQRYLKGEMKQRHVCPICSLALPDYTSLFMHIEEAHESAHDSESVQNALNPVYKVRQLYDKRLNPDLVGVGKFFGEKIASEFNQNAMVNIIGKMGMGKSNAAMRIGEETAKYIAKVKGGVPEDYFSIKNIAIMRLDSVIPILEELDNKRFNIVVLDDIGASYSARDFQKVINKNINKIFQTFRDTNTLVILTTPSTFLIDKVARRLAHYQIEITEQRFEEQISIGKLLEIVDQYRNSGKQFYHFPVYNGVKYPRIVFPRASAGLVADYEIKRKEIRQAMMAESIVNIREDDAGVSSVKPEKIPRHLQIAEEVLRRIKANPKISISQLSTDLTCSRDTIVKAKQHLISTGCDVGGKKPSPLL
jgi:hypothetical protein